MKNKWGFEMAPKEEMEAYSRIARESFMNQKRKDVIKNLEHHKKYTAGFAENFNK
jgi:hypothetical protein